MTLLQSFEINKLEQECNSILENNKVKFVGVINNLGNLMAGGSAKDAMPIGTEELQKMMYMQLKLDLNMRKDYDGLFGPVIYVVSKRINAQKVSIPIGTYMILLISEPNFDFESILKKNMPIFKSILCNSQ